jgi:hypothetical protein
MLSRTKILKTILCWNHKKAQTFKKLIKAKSLKILKKHVKSKIQCT